jgi:DNA-binding response OmpR family regulator
MSTILLVEDHPEVLSVLSEGLAEEFDVVAARTGNEALACLARPEYAIDAAILDWMLPDMPGIELLRRLRNQQMQVPVLFLSGYILPPEALAAAPCMRKPCTAQELCARLRILLARAPNPVAWTAAAA